MESGPEGAPCGRGADPPLPKGPCLESGPRECKTPPQQLCQGGAKMGCSQGPRGKCIIHIREPRGRGAPRDLSSVPTGKSCLDSPPTPSYSKANLDSTPHQAEMSSSLTHSPKMCSFWLDQGSSGEAEIERGPGTTPGFRGG